MLGGVLGLLLGVGLAFTRNVLDNKVRKPEDLRKRGFNVLGVIPGMERLIRTDFDRRETVAVDGRALSTRLIALLNPLSPIAEAYRRLRTNIQFSRPDGEVRTILVSSAGPGEGKSVTSMNLAVTVAQAGQRTVYIDADLRKPVGHKMMGQSREPGLVDLLFEPGRTDYEPFASPVDNLYIIPAGRSVPNPSEIVGSQRMRDLLVSLKKDFDFIIVDTPPILAVTDALSVATQVDGVLLVCSAVETTWQAVERSNEAVAAGQLEAKLVRPRAAAMLDAADATVPHLVVGEAGRLIAAGLLLGPGFNFYALHRLRHDSLLAIARCRATSGCGWGPNGAIQTLPARRCHSR